MAVLAIAAVGAGVGAAIGGTFLGMSAAAVGWNLGMVAGGMLFAPKMPNQYGPRLGDLKVQSSAYGNPIPIIYGAMRVSGNMIWAADILETAHTTESGGGGKGGGGGGATQTNYTYSQSFAIALCEGEIAGIRKVWANGKLIYNLSDTADIATIVASNNSASGMRIYTGSETQTADSLIEANVGAADTPAYRGTAYVVFENMQLADYGNRTPNLEFEVVDIGSYAHLAGERTNYSAPVYSPVADTKTNSIWVTSGSSYISKIDSYTGTRVDFTGFNFSNGIAFDPVTDSVWVANSNGNTVSKVNIYTGAKVDYPAVNSPREVAFDSKTNSVWVSMSGADIISKFDVSSGNRTDYTVGDFPAGVAFDPVTDSVWVANLSSDTVSKVNIYTGDRIDYTTGDQPNGVAFDSVTESIWVAIYGGSVVSKFNIYTGTKTDYAVGSLPSHVAFDAITESVWVTNYSSNTVSKVDIHTGSKTDYTSFQSPSGICFDTSTNAVWATNNSGSTISKINVADYGLSTTDPQLSTIVSNICTRASLTAGKIDVTALTDTVHGYVVQRGTARSQLEQLMQAFYFDAVESDGKIKFVKRGGSVAVSIPEDDLAAHEYGSAIPDTLLINRQQEMELPVEFNVQYMDSGAAYAVGSQRSQRLTTDSENKQSINLAIAMTAIKAKQISDVLMYDAWTGRTTFDQSHGYKYAYLEPTDIISVTKGNRTYTMRIVDEDASGGIYRRQAVLEDTSVYSQTSTAASALAPSETVSSVPITNLMLLDIPLLRDADDGVGFYAAACGYAAGWPGAQTYKSNDDGATWSNFGNAFLNGAAIGVASNALGNFTQNIFDESSTVTVVMINGTLSSDTELNVLNGANVALIGNEVFQFKNATLTATNTYVLTGLLRGRMGTEWATSTHAIGDRFVLLSASTTYIFDGSSVEYGLNRKYRGVTFGNFLDAATTTSFTHNAVAKECYAPVQLGGGRNAAGDLTLNWIRRTRIGGGWNNYADVSLGEASEAYVVEIYANSSYATLKRTITGITSTTTSYTAAQQTTDFGAPQATVYWKAYQVSSTVGNGYEARGAT